MTLEAGFQDHVLYERLDSHIGLVTLNRPEKRNAISPDMASTLEQIVETAENDREIRVMILRSCDHRVFCAGADLGAVVAGKPEGLETSRSGFGGFVYARRLTRAGVAVELHVWPGAFHAFGAYDAHVSREARRVARTAIKRALHGDAK